MIAFEVRDRPGRECDGDGVGSGEFRAGRYAYVAHVIYRRSRPAAGRKTRSGNRHER